MEGLSFVVRPAGTRARRLPGFALGRELRERRRRAGHRRVVTVAAAIGIDRSLIDGIELGDYDDRANPKHLTKWSRERLLRLVSYYGLAPLRASAYLRLALLARAFDEDESDEPVYEDEWREIGGTLWDTKADLSRQRIGLDVASILERHRPQWNEYLIERRRRGEPAELPETIEPEGREPTRPVQLSQLSPAAADVMDFLGHATIGAAPVRLLERAGVAAGEILPALRELRDARLVTVVEEQDDLVIDVLAGFRRALRSAPEPRSRWRGEGWAWRTGLRYLALSIQDEARQRAVLPLGDLRNYLGWLTAAVQAGENREALIAWTKLSRYLWEIGKRELFAKAEEVGSQALSDLGTTAPQARRLLRGLHTAELAYLEIDRGNLARAVELGEQALATFVAIGDRAGQSIAHRYLGRTHYRRRADDLARRHYQEALDCLAEIERAEGYALPARAIDELKRLELFAALIVGYRVYVGDTTPSKAELHNLLASLELKAGNLKDAIQSATLSVRLYKAAPNRWPGSEAAPLLTRARCYVRNGDPQRARRDLRQALAVAEDNDRGDLKSGILIRLAELEIDRRRYSEARVSLDSAEVIQGRVEIPGDRDRIAQLRARLQG